MQSTTLPSLRSSFFIEAPALYGKRVYCQKIFGKKLLAFRCFFHIISFVESTKTKSRYYISSNHTIMSQLNEPGEIMRLQKYMSQAGVCSRRKAEEYITRWLVLVNGEKATLGMSVNPEIDEIIINDKVVEERSELVYYKLNKPRDIITTCKQDGESSILDVVDIPERVFPIGRLDKETTGLILLTNDGRLSNFLMHPRYEHEKEYAVEVYGRIEDDALEDMRCGVMVLGKMTKPAEINRLSSWKFAIVLTEGRNRQIRRMVEAVGHTVKKLKRIRIENILLGDLEEGEYKALNTTELQGLFKKLGI